LRPRTIADGFGYYRRLAAIAGVAAPTGLRGGRNRGHRARELGAVFPGGVELNGGFPCGTRITAKNVPRTRMFFTHTLRGDGRWKARLPDRYRRQSGR